MTTPKQERKTIQTPFGEATVHDWRNYKVVNETRASLSFDHFVANRKDYGSMTLYLEAPKRAWEVAPYLSTSTYGAITEAARRALRDYFVPDGQIIEDLAPYLEEMDGDDVRASLKARIAYVALRGLDDAINETVDRNDAEGRALAAELLDEILAEVKAERQDGKKYIQIYLDR